MIVKPTVRVRREPRSTVPGIAALCFIIIEMMTAVALAVMDNHHVGTAWMVGVALPLGLSGLYILLSLRVADQWEKSVVLRMGKFIGLRGPGPFWIIPVVDTVSSVVDHRVMRSPSTPFEADVPTSIPRRNSPDMRSPFHQVGRRF